jgi:hypothetical protein
VYVDRFYTSVELIKALDEMDLFVTGTIMQNRIPKDLHIGKSTKKFKDMQRGDFEKHRLKYLKRGTSNRYGLAGLVAWKDHTIVYAISNDTNTRDTDGECKRRSKDGIITLKRPKLIAKYNEFMGGVDLADQRRLHCNSTIMGSNRWWLKLFFYTFDVGTSNALVVYNIAMKKELNMVDFRLQLLENFVGTSAPRFVTTFVPLEHVQIHSDVRARCAYCAVFSRVSRTRVRCSTCQVPLCSVGHGRKEVDCFALAHENEQTTRIVKAKAQAMQTFARHNTPKSNA